MENWILIFLVFLRRNLVSAKVIREYLDRSTIEIEFSFEKDASTVLVTKNR